MGFIETVSSPLGQIFSIIALTIVAPSVFLFKQYSRLLDHVQLTFLYFLVFSSLSQPFGSYLSNSWSQFIPNFLSFCKEGEITCDLGFALSFTICLIGVIFMLFLIVSFEKCRKPQIRFQPVYSVFKGFFRWTYLPLSYFSLLYLLRDLKDGTSTNLIPSAIIVGWTVIFPTFQLIYYKGVRQQKQGNWVKWLEFFSYLRLFSIALIFTLGQIIETKTTISKYFIYGPLVIYAILFAWKKEFIFKAAERTIFILGQATGIAIYSIYLFYKQNLIKYELDFLGLSIILLLQIIALTIQIVSLLKYGRTRPQKINPQNMQPSEQRALQNQDQSLSGDFSPKRKNKFDQSQNLQNSRDSLVLSVRKRNEIKKRR